jgi:hypothetical protein
MASESFQKKQTTINSVIEQLATKASAKGANDWLRSPQSAPLLSQILQIAEQNTAKDYALFIHRFLNQYLEAKVDYANKNPGSVGKLVADFEWIIDNMLNTAATENAIKADPHLRKAIHEVLDNYKAILEKNISKNPKLFYAQCQQMFKLASEPCSYKVNYNFKSAWSKDTFKEILSLAEADKQYGAGVIGILANYADVRKIIADPKIAARTLPLLNRAKEAVEEHTLLLNRSDDSQITPPVSPTTFSTVSTVTILEKSGASSRASSATPDTHWYEDEEVSRLLEGFSKDYKQFGIFTPILGSDWLSGNDLQNQLQEMTNQRLSAVGEESNPAAAQYTKSEVLIPLNLGNAHWVLLYLKYDKKNITAPAQIKYIDPFGKEPIANVVAAINAAFQDVGAVSIEHNITRLQEDGHNCGPWIVVMANYLMNYIDSYGRPINNISVVMQGLQNTDITEARAQQQELLGRSRTGSSSTVSLAEPATYEQALSRMRAHASSTPLEKIPDNISLYERFFLSSTLPFLKMNLSGLQSVDFKVGAKQFPLPIPSSASHTMAGLLYKLVDHFYANEASQTEAQQIEILDQVMDKVFKFLFNTLSTHPNPYSGGNPHPTQPNESRKNIQAELMLALQHSHALSQYNHKLQPPGKMPSFEGLFQQGSNPGSLPWPAVVEQLMPGYKPLIKGQLPKIDATSGDKHSETRHSNLHH